MTSPVNGIVAYGAAAEPEPLLDALARVRSQARYAYHTTRDRLRWRTGDLSQVDYRNYQDATTLNRGDQAIVDAVLKKMSMRDRNLNFRRTNWGKLGEIPISTAMVAVCGGGYIFMDRDAQLPFRLRSDSEMFGRITTPVVWMGVGINQLIEPNQRQASHMADAASATLASLLVRADLISVRDRATQQILVALTEKPIYMVGDPALYLSPPRASVRPMNERLRVGINFPFHGKTPNEHIRRDLEQYIILLKKIKAKFSCEFTYMVHYSTELILARLLKDAGIPLEIVSGTPDHLISSYGELDFHLGGMLHSCILATSAGTPCIGLAYDVKHSGFFDSINLSDHCISVADLDINLIFQKFCAMHSSSHVLREHILKRRIELESEFDRFLDRAMALLPKHSSTPKTSSNTAMQGQRPAFRQKVL